MTWIESFDSIEEMQQIIAEREEAANTGLLDIQIELRDDFDNTRYWVRPYPEANCLIFGEAWSFKGACESSAQYVEPRIGVGSAVHKMMDLGLSDDVEAYKQRYEESLDEAVFEIRTYVQSRRRGYLRGEAWSVLEPRGEYGDTHVATVMPISKRAFDEARASGWKAVDVDPLTLDLIGEAAAYKGGWTPTLVQELRDHQKRMQRT